MKFGHRFVLVVTLLCVAAVARAQQPGVVVGQARTMMSAHWSESPHAVEQLYCVTRWGIDTSAGVLYVLGVERAVVVQATSAGIVGHCSDPTTPTVHTHTPTTCRATHCTHGGPDAWQCFASPGDQATIERLGAPFGVVQCAKDAFVFYANYTIGAPPDTL